MEIIDHISSLINAIENNDIGITEIKLYQCDNRTVCSSSLRKIVPKNKYIYQLVGINGSMIFFNEIEKMVAKKLDCMAISDIATTIQTVVNNR